MSRKPRTREVVIAPLQDRWVLAEEFPTLIGRSESWVRVEMASEKFPTPIKGMGNPRVWAGNDIAEWMLAMKESRIEEWRDRYYGELQEQA